MVLWFSSCLSKGPVVIIILLKKYDNLIILLVYEATPLAIRILSVYTVFFFLPILLASRGYSRFIELIGFKPADVVNTNPSKNTASQNLPPENTVM